MAKTLREILDMSWQRRADLLDNMTPRELAVLFNYLHQVPVEEKDKEEFESFYLTVCSILRDQRERI